MTNPIPHSSMFATPDSLDDLMTYIENYSGNERAVAMVCSMMALNLAHKLVEQEKIHESQN
jgi:hypothetical protein